jgi:hypothetical protein
MRGLKVTGHSGGVGSVSTCDLGRGYPERRPVCRRSLLELRRVPRAASCERLRSSARWMVVIGQGAHSALSMHDVYGALDARSEPRHDVQPCHRLLTSLSQAHQPPTPRPTSRSRC